MYYIKHHGAEIAIEDNNTFTRCGQCGEEMAIDLNDAVQDGSLDLYGTTWYCDECSYERALKHPDEDWAQKVLAHHKGV
jgi:hypothetical protein